MDCLSETEFTVPVHMPLGTYSTIAISIVMTTILRDKMYYVYGHLPLKTAAITVEKVNNTPISITMYVGPESNLEVTY